ncbi:hypothetical protein R1T16_01300 [Flavobacterium sp. DG1-102-2]|uniref:hypothetical protein n=1 Tax=Flavobacterium sp. DG1-102-2 TaxID=3081663 RepID=UPI002949A0F8|nr:hypothetical protein [Flavobacterium sp. DG1-102-2]MDV6167040.1 hypothetical protein [Flavobacterium sp. DG1-102-2]
MINEDKKHSNDDQSQNKPAHNHQENTYNSHSSKNEDIDDTDKYLAMEQPGVQYTSDTSPTRNSDQADFGEEKHDGQWSEEGGNSKNSDAFNQDDYLLEDNIDLDEDQNQSISSDDEDFEETNERY